MSDATEAGADTRTQQRRAPRRAPGGDAAARRPNDPPDADAPTADDAPAPADTTPPTTETPADAAPPTEEPRQRAYPRERLLGADGPKIAGHPHHVIVGALAGADADAFTREGIETLCAAFLERPDRPNGEEA